VNQQTSLLTSGTQLVGKVLVYYTFFGDRTMAVINDGDDLIDFLMQYEFWNVTRETSGRIIIVVRCKNREYVKVWSRKKETIYEAMERISEKIDEVDNA
jgi:hypothetical protein